MPLNYSLCAEMGHTGKFCPNFVTKWVPKVPQVPAMSSKDDAMPQATAEIDDVVPRAAIENSKDDAMPPSGSATNPSASSFAESSDKNDIPFQPVKLAKGSNVQAEPLISMSPNTQSGNPPKVSGVFASKSNGVFSAKSKLPASKVSNPFSILETVLEEIQAKSCVDPSVAGKENVARTVEDGNIDKLTLDPPVTRKRNQSKKWGAAGNKNQL